MRIVPRRVLPLRILDWHNRCIYKGQCMVGRSCIVRISSFKESMHRFLDLGEMMTLVLSQGFPT